METRKVILSFLALALAALAPSAELNWSDNSDNEDGFYIERSEAGAAFLRIAEVPANVSTYSDANTKYGVEYAYRVNAFNEWGVSGYTNIAKHTKARPQLDDIEQGAPPSSPGDTLTASKLARGLEAFADAIKTPANTNLD